jgi:putative membrane protein
MFSGLLVLGLCCGLVPMVLAAKAREDKKTDEQAVVLLISNFNLAQINDGQLTAKRAQSADLRKFAQGMAGDCSKFNKELQTLCADKKWKFTIALDREHQAAFDHMSSLEGAAFDREYLKYELSEIQAAINLMEEEGKNGADADLKAWSSRELSMLRTHLGAARNLETTVNKAGGVPGKIDEPGFVMLVTGANLSEIANGQLAAKQGNDADVRKFAQMMVTDHTKANKELTTLANEKKWGVSTSVDREKQAFHDRLAGLSGNELDKAYLQNQVNEHKNVIALFEQEVRDGKDADLKAWAQRMLPALRDHEKMARDLWDRVKGK